MCTFVCGNLNLRQVENRVRGVRGGGTIMANYGTSIFFDDGFYCFVSVDGCMQLYKSFTLRTTNMLFIVCCIHWSIGNRLSFNTFFFIEKHQLNR